jgi:hypothetical protein
MQVEREKQVAQITIYPAKRAKTNHGLLNAEV